MHPIDVQAANLEAVLEGLATDPRFVGGAVTMPHKETIAAWLGPDRLSPEAARIGAVNCLYRDDQGTLVGTNTDGEGALVSLERIAGPVAGKKVMLLGPGGAGKAVAAYLAGAGAQVTLAARDPQSARDFAGKIGAKHIPMSAAPDALSSTDILVNCTSVGFAQSDPKRFSARSVRAGQVAVWGSCLRHHLRSRSYGASCPIFRARSDNAEWRADES